MVTVRQLPLQAKRIKLFHVENLYRTDH